MQAQHTRKPMTAKTKISNLVLTRILMAQATNNHQKAIIQADSLQGGKTKEGSTYKTLEGNVIIERGEITIYSETATYHDDSKNITAKGKVKIVHKSGAEISVQSLIY